MKVALLLFGQPRHPLRFHLMNHHDKYPDLIFVFPPVFLPSQHAYSNLTKNIAEAESEMGTNAFWEPSAECLKFQQFRQTFPLDRLCPIRFSLDRITADGHKHA